MVIFQNRYIQAAEQLMRLWSGARGQGVGEVETIRTELDALAERVGVDLELARQLTPESLELLVAPEGSTDPLRTWLVAELFYVSGRVAEQAGEAAVAMESDRRALRLYRRVDRERLPDANLPDPGSRSAELSERLGNARGES
jgi:hypothetical protein